jgi:hypothetical protein
VVPRKRKAKEIQSQTSQKLQVSFFALGRSNERKWGHFEVRLIMEARTTELISPRDTLRPKFIYHLKFGFDKLVRTNLFTGEQSCLKVLHQFMFDCRWSELPGGSLLVTGGIEDNPAVREVVKIDTLREFAVSSQPPMHTARYYHATVYHAQYLYVLAGSNHSYLRDCERYLVAESRWEELPALPVAGYAMSAVELDDSLYALGGIAEGDLDTIQRLSLDSLTWELMQVKLPQATSWFPCFKTNTEVYLMIKETLYAFTSLEVKPVKTLGRSISWCEASYYSRGTLYTSTTYNAIVSLAVGELTSL